MLPTVYLWLKSGGEVKKVILSVLVLILANSAFAQDLQVFKERREILMQKMGKVLVWSLQVKSTTVPNSPPILIFIT